MMNPLCKCGCGLEVARPFNKYILGHSTPTRKLTLGQINYAREQCHVYGRSQQSLANELGVSQAAICSLLMIPWWGEKRNIHGRDIVRADELERRNDLIAARRALRAVRNLMKQMRRQARVWE